MLNRKKANEQLDDELEFHIERQITENREAGMSEEEARREALKLFGNPASLRDQAAETWNWNWLEQLLRDLRQSTRSLMHTPGFSIVAIAVLALGIGANVALFTLVHSVLLKPYPFPNEDRLVRIYEANTQGGYKDNIVAGGDFGDWRAHATSFAEIAAKKAVTYSLSGGESELPELALTEQVSWNLFPMLGVHAALGRVFSSTDDRPEAAQTVVLSWGLWKRRFGGDPAMLGSRILLDARPYTVIGVLPAWFTYPDTRVQLWTAMYRDRSPEVMAAHDAHNLDIVGRLKPGVSLTQAQAEIAGIQAGIRRQYPNGPVNDSANLRPLVDSEVHGVKDGFYALFAATGCLLLIACLNIANLLVARSAARRKEMAIRTALGGSRGRLIRSHILESLLLAAAGGGLGLILAFGALRWLAVSQPDIPRLDTVHIDSWAVLFAAAVVMICGLLAGMIPALSAGDRRILETLQEAGRSHSGSLGKVRLRKVLLALEVSLTVVLLVGAGLLLKTYQHLRAVDMGCAVRNVLTMSIRLPKGSYRDAPQMASFYDTLLERVRQLPGVRAAGLNTILPGQGHYEDDIFTIPEHPPLPQGQLLDASTYLADPGYFAAMQIPVIEGRVFDNSARLDKANEIVISQELVRKYFPNDDPIGKHIVAPMVLDGRTLRIVGVVGDIHETPASPIIPTLYFPLLSGTARGIDLVVRTAQNPAALATPVERVIAGIDRDLPVADVLSMDQLVQTSLADQSLDALLLAGFGGLSLLLAGVGLFGVLSYVVAQRTTEIGIRIALGAQREQVVRQFLTDGLKPAVYGLVLGLGASAMVTRLLSSLLYQTQALDPAVFVAVSAALLLVAALACLLPAWRASRLDPMQALRRE